MRLGSLFSGIGGIDLGFEQAGWEVAWQSEIDPFSNRILARHWPEVPNLGDITSIDTRPGKLPAVDLVAGGFPCQDLSVAGKRKGLAGERSSLFWEFHRVVGDTRPPWLLLENVAGLLSSNDGRDMALVVASLADLGYGLSWRVLDSRHFGVPQRRRRVFIVGRLGAFCPPEVLFEPESLRGDTLEGGETGADVAHALKTRTGERRDPSAESYVVNARQDPIIGDPALDGYRHSHAVAVRLAQTSSNGWGISEDATHALDESGGDAVAFRKRTLPHGRDGQDEQWEPTSQANTLTVDPRPSTLVGAAPDPDGDGEVARLPPKLDAPRARTLGNAVTVPVARWIASRIMAHHD